MTLLPGYRFAVAARFHLEADWAARLRVGAGVEDAGGRFFPRGPWAAPTARDLAVLVGEAPSRSLSLVGAEPARAGSAEDDPDAIALFQLPEHLRSAWWDILSEAAESGGPLRGFDGFAARVTEFLNFKRLNVPAGARLEAIVTAAGERSIRRDPDTGAPSGLGPTVAPWAPTADAGAVQKLWGVVNLGDEPSGVVLLNLPFAALAAQLAPAPATIGELTERFLRAFPDYPPVRVRLGPGEGCRLPASGLVLDGDPTGKDEPDMLLLISEEGTDPTPRAAKG